MRRGWIYLIVGLVVVLFIGVGVGLYQLGGADQSALERLRDIAIFFMVLGGVVVVVLLGALVGVGIWLGLLLRDKVIPLLEEATAMATRVRGTTEFMTEEVVRPVISVYSTVAGVRAMVRTVTGRQSKP